MIKIESFFSIALLLVLAYYPPTMNAQLKLSADKAPVIYTSTNEISVSYKDTIVCLDVLSNTDWEVKESEWIKQIQKGASSNLLYLAVAQNDGVARNGKITLENADGSAKKNITISQSKENFAEFIKGNIKVPVSSGYASSYQSGGDISLSYDGNFNTLYHSNWNNGTYAEKPNYFPIKLQYNFKNADRIDYFVYYPRQSGSNGHFGKVKVSYSTTDNPVLQFYKEYDFEKSSAASRVNFVDGIINPKTIQIEVLSGGGDAQGFAACAEMEFYKIREQDSDFDVFADNLYSTLKPGVTQEQINELKNLFVKNLASKILKGEYSLDYRLAEYEAYKDPVALGKELLIGDGYSRMENMTGILVTQGKNVIVVEGLEEGKRLGLIVSNLYRLATPGYDADKDPKGWGLYKKTFPLTNGLNVINMTEWDGLAYISYFSATPETENKVKVHFVNGAVNGYFDLERGDTNEDWDNMLQNTIYPIVDARGKHCHIAFPVSAFRQYTAHQGKELVEVYDKLIDAQQELIGLKKYNLIPKNHIFVRVNYNYYMFRDGDGVAFEAGTMNRVASVANMTKNDEDACWGFSHEVGHVHQLQPYLTWAGLGEVSNNICTCYCIKLMGYQSRLSSAFESARTKIFGKNISYLTTDVFERLVPFWQLQLYFAGKGNQPDFYPDLYEALRHTKEETTAQAVLGTDWSKLSSTADIVLYQLNFIKKASIVSGINLTDYFEKWGFLWVGRMTVGDYADGSYNLTQDRVTKFKAEMKALGLKELDETTLNDMINQEN